MDDIIPEDDNVIDFTLYKLKRTIEAMRKVNRTDIVTVLEDALDSYELGLVDIYFKNGWPAVYYPELSEESDMTD